MTKPSSGVTARRCLTLALLIGLAPTPSHATPEPWSALSAAVREGMPTLDLRARAERVSSDSSATPDLATALTLRARMGYGTQRWNGWDASIEWENVAAVDRDAYNSRRNGQATRPVIADPTGADLNRWLLRYSGIAGSQIQFGRQRLVFDNARWIGNSGWRANEQTFDGWLLSNGSIDGVAISYAHLDQVNAIDFTEVPLDAELMNLRWLAHPGLAITAYVYQLDFEVPTAKRRSTRSVGLRLSGEWERASGLKSRYVAEYAEQRSRDTLSAPARAAYRLLEAGLQYAGLRAALGYEVLGSDHGRYGLQTPLASLHAFNGWADQFVHTPLGGLRDGYASISGSLGTVALTATYHRYDADADDARYGTEWGVQAQRALSAQLNVLAKAARYRAADYAEDSDTLWLQLEYTLH